MKIFFSVGEPSGDLHGANLIRALRAQHPYVHCVGYGGPKMAEAGCELHEDLTALAVMWIWRVLLNIHKFFGLLSRAEKYFAAERPDAVVLIDYPGFNWWIARKAKAAGIPVYYYTPPQIWAWASWRVKKMRQFVDHVLCSLPFEEQWFRERGCNATFVGHPYFDEVRQHELDTAFVAAQKQQSGKLVTILPGSRTQEVEHNLRWFLRAARRVQDRVPHVRFSIACFKPRHAEYAKQLVANTRLPIEIHFGRTPELIAAADCCLAVSGSVSLELLFHTKPTVILYWVKNWAYVIQRCFRKTQYITLVNLLNAKDGLPARTGDYDPDVPGAEQVLFPEYLTSEDRSHDIAKRITAWLMDDAKRQHCVRGLTRLKEAVAHGGTSNKAAEYILNTLADPLSRKVPRPHFQPASRGQQGRRSDRPRGDAAAS